MRYFWRIFFWVKRNRLYSKGEILQGGGSIGCYSFICLSTDTGSKSIWKVSFLLINGKGHRFRRRGESLRSSLKRKKNFVRGGESGYEAPLHPKAPRKGKQYLEGKGGPSFRNRSW